MAAERVKMGIQVEGLRPALRVLRSLPKDANAEIRTQATEIAADEAARIQQAGRRSGGQAAQAAASVRARRDRLPGIVAGGSKRLGGDGNPAGGDLFFGAEFGGGARPTTQQFRPHRGTEGYWFWPTLREDAPRMLEKWAKVLDRMADKWGHR